MKSQYEEQAVEKSEWAEKEIHLMEQQKNLEHLLNQKSDEVKVLNEKVVNQSFIITTRDRMVADFQEKITSAEARNMDVNERNENLKKELQTGMKELEESKTEMLNLDLKGQERKTKDGEIKNIYHGNTLTKEV